MSLSHRRTRVWLFLLFQALYALTSSGNAFRVPDEFEVYYQAEHLTDAGDLSIPQSVPSGRFFGRVGLDGKPYAPYGPLIAILSLPHHLLARGVAWLAGIPRETVVWTFVVSGLTMLTTSTGAALAVVGFHRAAVGIGASGAVALLLSMMLGGASVLWTYGASFYSEGWQAAAFVWAAVCLIERRVPLAAVLLAIAGLTKFTSLVFVPGFVVAVLADTSAPTRVRLRAAAVIAAGAAVALAIHLGWNNFRFGDPLQFGYDWSETIPNLPARPFLLSELPRGLAVLLFSPGKSILLWAPVLLLSLQRWKTCPRGLLAGVTATAGGGLLFYGAYLFPEGGYAHGPRHLVPILPLLLLPAATPGRPWRRELVTACIAVGFTMAALSTSVSFLQDQAMGNDFQRLGYYERIDPLPGRPWNRYRLEYVPFVKTLKSSEWPVSAKVGAGADYFFFHLLRAKGTVAGARSIPIWLPAALLLGCSALLAFAVAALWRIGRVRLRREHHRGQIAIAGGERTMVIAPRAIGVALVVLSLAYLCLFVQRGWIPHDEGMLGQSAERVMAGDLPHVDYEEPYTGGLAWLHAGLFKITGVNLIYPRWLLFAGAILSQMLTYMILRRYLQPVGAALGAWVALGWSFPNYFAALPSWWLLVCALASLCAFIRFVDTGRVGYVVVAGVSAGISILIKQTGLYLLVALMLALLYGGGEHGDRITERRTWRLLCASAGLAAAGLAFAVLSSRLAIAELLYLLLPVAACSRLMLTASGQPASPNLARRLLAPAIAAASAAAPLIVFLAPYLIDHRIGRLVNGVLILPQKRLQFAAFEMPPAYWLAAGIPLAALLVWAARLDRSALKRATPAFWALAVAVPVLSLYDATSYQLIWQSARASVALLPVVICVLLFAHRIADARERWILFGCATMLAWSSLVQFPFSAPIYFCYVTPLGVVAAVALAGNSGALQRPVVSASAVLLLLFSLLSMNRGYVYNLGFDHEAYAMNVPLNHPKADLTVSASDAVTYQRVVEVVTQHLDGGSLVAGPDCPEIYFLAGKFNPSGALFDFFVTDPDIRQGLDDLPGWRKARVVVLNHRRTFTPGLSTHLVTSVRSHFPHWTSAGPFEVRWR
jgi:hypothetical protein